MSPVQKLENVLDETFNKKAPYQLPQSAKTGIANALWWISLILGGLQVWAAWIFWRDAHRVNELVDWANSWSTAFGGQVSASHIGVFFYVSVAALAVSGALLLLAVGGLKTFKKAGWNLLFYGLILNLVYGIVRMFSEYGNDATYLIESIVSAVIGGYLLFQVRSIFVTGKAPVVTTKK